MFEGGGQIAPLMCYPAQAVVRLKQVGGKVYGAKVAGLRLAVAEQVQGVAEVHVRFGVAGIGADGIAVGVRRILQPAHVLEHAGQIVVRVGQRGVEIDGAPKGIDCILGAVQFF
jgi:hypothetical protein